MQITIDHLENEFPKKTKRSNRLEKKMHIGSHALVIFDVELRHDNSFTRVLDNGLAGDWYDELYDALDSCGAPFETFCTTLSTTSIMVCVPASEYTDTLAMDTAVAMQFAISQIDPAVANTTKIIITVGDAYYGQW